MKKYLKITWQELEAYDFLKPDTTGLNMSILFDCEQNYIYFKHPLVVLVSNSYDENNLLDLIPITCDKYTEILYNSKKIKLFSRDINKVRLWIMKYHNKIKELADMKIDIIEFSNFLKQQKRLNENMNHLNEMAILKKEFTGLAYDLWIDNGQAWRKSGHSCYRLKVQTPDNSSSSKSWNIFRFDLMEFEIEKMKEQYTPKFYKELKLFIEANKETIEKITLGDKQYETEEIFPMFLTLSQIKEKKNILDEPDGKISKHYYLDKDKKYTVLLNDDNNEIRFTIVKTDTYENVIDNQWYITIVPNSLKYINNQLYVSAINDDGEIIYVKINNL